MAKKVKQTNGFVTQGWMLDVSDDFREVIAYAIVFNFSQDGDSEFKGSISYIAEWLKCSRPTVIKVMQSLENKGLIIKRQETINGVVFNRYVAVVPDTIEGSKEILLRGKENLPSGKETLPKYNKDNNKENIDNNINIVQTDLFGNPEETGNVAKKKQEEEIAQIEEAKKLLDEEFNRLYNLYGRKQAKASAMKEWQRLSREDRNAVLEKTPAWVEHYNSKHTTREFQPLLSTFLHQRRWEDELENLILQTDGTTIRQQRSGSRITESAASNASINEAARQLSNLLGG